GDRSATATTLVDAWMHQPDIRHAADPLVISLKDQGRITAFLDHGEPTGSPATDATSRKAITTSGTEDPRLLIIGIPTYAQMPDTTISPMPGTDPLMLQETDKAAKTLLTIVKS
ncbi:MAG: exopolyphosphatase, partial [Corynebacterium sp.]|nr:exopolyphosphatase [Corynebacterium sp.]